MTIEDKALKLTERKFLEIKLPNFVQVDPEKIKTLADVIEIIKILCISVDINQHAGAGIKRLLVDKEGAE